MRTTKTIVVSSIIAIACLIALTSCSLSNRLFAATEGSISSSICKAWEVTYSESYLIASNRGMSQQTPTPIEVGWEPFAITQNGWMIVRRCASK
jgi:hypothetical protein